MTPEVEAIKNDLRRCKTIKDAHDCYNHHHPRLREMWNEGKDMRAMCHQIKNLRDYIIHGIKHGLPN